MDDYFDLVERQLGELVARGAHRRARVARRLPVRRIPATAVLLACSAAVAVAVAAAVLLNARTAVRRPVTPSGALATHGSCATAGRRLGSIAFAARGHLELVDLSDCRMRRLAVGVGGDVRFSPDHRWVSYARSVNGNPAGPYVVPVGGGAPRAPLGAGILAWAWARSGESLYGLNGHGELLQATPTGAVRVVARDLGVPAASAYASAAPSPLGSRVAVDSSRCSRSPQEIELRTVDVATGERVAALRSATEPVEFAGWSPDGRWLLYWPDELCSASIAADGMPLDAVAAAGGGRPIRAVGHMLLFPDYLSWCGQRLIAAAGSSRETQLGSRLVVTGPPTWRQRTIEPAGKLSWVSPACSPSGDLVAAAAGPSSQNPGFGRQHRSIWLLAPDGSGLRQLTAPPKSDLSDEAPQFSSDGRWILFVRSRLVFVGASTTSRATLELVPAAPGPAAAKPIPVASFTSSDVSYYDHFDWPTEIDWTAAAQR
ncbi:MAG: hypothetical protein ACRDMX_05970 [Solirubrobacteraceae bacterium]